MKALLKVLLLLALIPIFLVLVLPLFLNPNDYKDEISAWVADNTGRRLTLEGDLELSFFPWVGVEVHQAALSQPAGFGDPPFARVQVAQVRLSLPALLRGRVEVGEVLGAGLSLHLIRAADGRTNWQDWSGRGAVPAVAVRPLSPAVRDAWVGSEPLTPPLPAGSGEGIDLAGVRILWDDQEVPRDGKARGDGDQVTQLLLEDLSVTIPRLDPKGPLDLRVSGQVTGLGREGAAHLVLEATTRLPAADQTLIPTPFTLRLQDLTLGDQGRLEAQLRGTVEGDLKVAAYRFTGLELTLEVNGGGLATKPVRLTGRGELDWNGGAETAALRHLVLESGSLRLRGAGTATGLGHVPDWRGVMTLEPWNARTWLSDQGLALAPLADAGALTRVALTADWRWTGGRLDLGELDLALDETRVQGDGSWIPGAPGRFEFDLRADRLALDGYLPPPEVATLMPTAEGLASSAPAAEAWGLSSPPAQRLASSSLSGPSTATMTPSSHEELPMAMVSVPTSPWVAKPPPLPVRLLAPEAMAQEQRPPQTSIQGPMPPEGWLPAQGEGPSQDKVMGVRREATRDSTWGMVRPASAAPARSSPLGAIALDGRVRIDHLTWRGLTFGGFDGHLSGKEAQFLVREQVAHFYSGSLSGEVELDARPAVPLISLRQKAVGVSFGDLLRALLGEESPLSGLGDLEAELTSQGLTKAELLASLSGRAGLRMPEGQFQGFDLEALVQGIEAQIRGQAPPGKPQGGGRTRFSRLGATARIEQGILNTQDLRVESGHFRVNGKGRIDLPREALDLTLLARVEQAPAGSSLKQVEGINIPLRVTGGLQSPQIQIDPGPVVEELAKRRIQRELGGPKGDALKQLEQRTGIPGLEQGLKSLLGR